MNKKDSISEHSKLSKPAIDILVKFEESNLKILDNDDICDIKKSIMSLRKRTGFFGYTSIILFIIDIVLSYLLVQNIVVW